MLLKVLHDFADAGNTVTGGRSIISTSSKRPIGASTSAPREAAAAAGSSPSARPSKSPPSQLRYTGQVARALSESAVVGETRVRSEKTASGGAKAAGNGQVAIDHRLRRSAAQSQGDRRRNPPRSDDRLLRLEWLRQEFAGHGYDLCRRAATLRRKPQFLCPAPFVGQMQKPKLDHIEGLSPAIAIEQKHMGHTPRSTVGTVTEIYDYFRAC